MNWWPLLDVLLVVLATARLIRLVITDDVGLWLVRRPAQSWAHYHDTPIPYPDGVTVHPGPTYEQRVFRDRYLSEHEPDPANGWRSKLYSGLECPFCVGFWIGVFVLGFLALAGGPGHLPEWSRYALGTLALNYVVAHAMSRLGD
jgi:hypothetical protein